MTKLSPRSWLVAGGRPEEPGAPLNTPLVPASNFLLGGDRVYSRDSAVPGWEALETLVGEVEEGGAIAFSSGMAAVAAVFDQLGAEKKITLPDDCYHGVSEIARRGESQGLWCVERIGVEDTEAWKVALLDSDLVWIESPSNPLLTVADLAAICAAPRKPGTFLVVDNTFATFLNQRPLALGADISMHSATKFIGGHSDLLAGLLVAKDEQLVLQLHKSRTIGGATPGALEAFLAVRGLRTLALRLETAQASALELAGWLESHPAVERVRFPGLASHPTHATAVSQLDGFGSMISFDVQGGAKVADIVCESTKLIRHATSLGSVESTMERRAAVPGQEHLPPGLLRLSVGIELCDDLKKDLQQAFGKAGLKSD